MDEYEELSSLMETIIKIRTDHLELKERVDRLTRTDKATGTWETCSCGNDDWNVATVEGKPLSMKCSACGVFRDFPRLVK